VLGQTAKSASEPEQMAAARELESLHNSQYFTEDYRDARGAEYRHNPMVYDKEERYPLEMHRLRAEVPVADRRTENRLTVSHYSINPVLPESRLQVNPFTAWGYVSYSVVEAGSKSDLTLGLAQLQCSWTRKNLETAK
jgi:hypothetical protein